jgi:hypothetical protein
MKNFKKFIKKFLVFFTIFLIFFSLSFKIAEANILSDLIAKSAEKGFAIIIGGIILLIYHLFKWILVLSIILFNWATMPLFGLPLTQPGTAPNGNPVIQVGWTLIRDITNMGFILGLVYIGIATALRISNFNTKKIFANLLIIALLINFSPVICGIVVDAGQLTMSFLLEDVTDWSKVIEVLDDAQATNWAEAIGGSANFNGVFGLATILLFCMLASLIFFSYFLLFLVRNITIWILVIFSPAAFFAYIFPQTNKLFKQWWHQLVQWTFVGAIAAFFIYLSYYTIYLATDNKINVSAIPLQSNMQENNVTKSPYYFVALVFLVIGFIFSTKTSAIGADIAINLGRTATLMVGGAAVAFGKGGLRKGAAYFGRRAFRGKEEKWNEMGKLRKIGAGFFSALGLKDLPADVSPTAERIARIGGWATFAFPPLAALRYGVKATRKYARDQYIEEYKRITEFESKVKNMDPLEARNILKTTRGTERSKLISAFMKRDDFAQFVDSGIITKEDIKEAGRFNKRWGFDSNIKTTLHALAGIGVSDEEVGNYIEEIREGLSPEQQKRIGLEATPEGTLKKIKNNLMKNSKLANLMSGDVAKKMLGDPNNYENLSPTVMSTLINKYGDEMVDTINSAIIKMNEDIIRNIFKKNAKMLSYLISTAANSLGIQTPTYRGEFLDKGVLNKIKNEINPPRNNVNISTSEVQSTQSKEGQGKKIDLSDIINVHQKRIESILQQLQQSQNEEEKKDYQKNLKIERRVIENYLREIDSALEALERKTTIFPSDQQEKERLKTYYQELENLLHKIPKIDK